jgi:paraquat-inducible protein B
MSGVLVEAELATHAQALAVEGTQFWVVKAEVSLQRVSGLETLLGPRYIAVRPGPVDSARRDRFEGLPDPPSTEPPTDGSVRVMLRATRLGSLAPGGPVVFREVRVGTIRAVELASDATGVLIAADIEPRYAPLVRDNSRFWRTGGVGVDFGLFRGLSVRAESLDQFISSGIALATPNRPGDAPAPGAVFDLADQPQDEWLEWRPSIPHGSQ